MGPPQVFGNYSKPLRASEVVLDDVQELGLSRGTLLLGEAVLHVGHHHAVLHGRRAAELPGPLVQVPPQRLHLLLAKTSAICHAYDSLTARQ